MANNPHNEYTLEALRRLCDKALAVLPNKAKDENSSGEERREVALDQLLHTVRLYTESDAERLDVPEEYTPSQKIEFQLYRYLEHEWSLYGDDKKQVIMDFLEHAIGKQ